MLNEKCRLTFVVVKLLIVVRCIAVTIPRGVAISAVAVALGIHGVAENQDELERVDDVGSKHGGAGQAYYVVTLPNPTFCPHFLMWKMETERTHDYWKILMTTVVAGVV